MAAELTLQARIQGLRTALESDLHALADEKAPELPWQPGERLSATVEALRTPDRGLLRVGSFLFDAVLPPGSIAGQRLELEFLGASPRVTFSLLDAADPTRASGAMQGKPVAEVEISPAARNLAALIRTVSSEGARGAPAVRDPVPLLPAASANAMALAGALKRAVENSGMFYESHLAQWMTGDRTTEQLRREPQAMLPRPPAPGRPDPGPATSAQATSDPDTSSAKPPGDLDAAALAAPPDTRSSRLADAVSAQALPQLRAQIDSLDARQIVWQGQAWPGLPVELRVDEPDDGAHPDVAPEAAPWTSHLRVVLPHLGEVRAELTLSGRSLRLGLVSPTPAGRAALEAAQSLLADAMQRADIQLIRFSVADERS